MAESPKEQWQLVKVLAELARTGMPLPEGLRAAAEEAGSTRLAAQLREVASRFESGAKWEDQLTEENSDGLPPYVVGVIRAGVRSGNLGDALDSLIDHDRAYRDVWRSISTSLWYPAVLLVATLGLLMAALLLVVRPMRSIFADFGTELPTVTQAWIRLSDELPTTLFWIGVVTASSLLLIRILGGKVGWSRFVSSIPILGPIIHLAGVAQMLRLLQIMLAHEVPLPEALRLTSSGVASPSMEQVARWLANGTEAGVPLGELVDSTQRLPASIVPVIRWGEKTDALAEAMRNAHEMLERRIRMRGSVLSILMGPMMLIFIGSAIGTLVIAMFMPLVSLISNLV